MIQDHEQARTNRRKEGQTKDISYKTLSATAGVQEILVCTGLI